MIKHFFILLFLVSCLQSFSQKLTYDSNGTIYNSEDEKISPTQIRELLANNEQLLANYNAGRSKKTAGNLMLWGGIGIICGKLIHNMYSSSSELVQNPNWNPSSPYSYQYIYTDERRTATLYYLGLASIIIAIPVKIGFSKKIKNVVTDYNNQKATGNINFEPSNLNLITNSNGIGFRLIFN